MKTRDRLRVRKRNVSYFDAVLNDALPRKERITLLSRLYSGMASGGKADRTQASVIRRDRLAKLAPLARAVHEALSYEPDGEKGLVKLSRTRLLDELHKWLWTDAERYDPPEGVSVDAIANDPELWPPVVKRSGKIVKRYKAWTPDRRTFRDVFRDMDIGDILNADADPAPAKGTLRTR